MHSIRCVLIFSAVSLSVVFDGFGQAEDPKETARQYVEVAMAMITETKAIDDARGLMVVAADLDTTNIKANYEAGNLQLRTIGKDLAVKYLLRVYRQDPDYNFSILFWIAKSYQYGLEFDKAIQYYNRYKEKLRKKSNYQGKDKIDLKQTERCIYECENGKQFVAEPGNFAVVNIGREINSEYEDYAPVLNEREDEIVFTTRRRDDNLNQNVYDDNKPYEDIFTAKKVGGKWGFAKNIGAVVNTPYHDSNLALSADGGTLYIFKDERGGDIYSCEKQKDGQWGDPVPLPGIINSSFEEKSISISKDEKTLYFSSNRPGGYGGLDIYQATKNSKGEWSDVKNLGDVINTEFDEDGPSVDFDNEGENITLFFSSKGHKGMGGHDIFKTSFVIAQGEWSRPLNLGYPINTPDDDVFFKSSSDGQRAYYSSVRDDGMGYTDIYMITIPEGLGHVPKDSVKMSETKPGDKPPVVDNTPKEPIVENTEPVVENTEPVKEPIKQPIKEPVKTVPPKKELIPLKFQVSVVNASDKTPLNAKVKLAGLRDNVIVGSTANSDGTYEFRIVEPKAKDYRLSVELEGYIFQNLRVRIEGASDNEKTITRTVEMRKLSVGATSILHNIYFDFDKATLQTDSYNELNKLETMMRQNENLIVEIGGHTDSFGSNAYNMILSQKRAETVKDFLTKRGIDARRIKAVGYGKSKPLASNDDEQEGRELNRRVVFQVLQN